MRAPPAPASLAAPVASVAAHAVVAWAASLALVACGVFSGQDVGGPRADGAWRTPARVAVRPVEADPGVVACVEPERHGFEGGERGTGWVDRCGWRTRQRCRDECSLLAPCHLECRDETPPAQRLANAALYVRRLFAAAERCPEAEVGAERTDGARGATSASAPASGSAWRVTGCDKRGRFQCESGGGHASGQRCERQSFYDETRAELLDELRPAFLHALGDRVECAPRVVGGTTPAVTLADGRPGVAVALEACGRQLAYACVRPDLVPLGTPACREAARAPATIDAARAVLAERVTSELGCALGPSDAQLAREELRSDLRWLIWRVRLCNATRDVRAVRCATESLVDDALRGCWIDTPEADAAAALREVGRLLEDDDASCRADRRTVERLSSDGDAHLVRGRCFGAPAAQRPALYRCQNDYAHDAARCAPDDATMRAAAALEAGARARLARDERCPEDKVTTLPVDGRPGRWVARAEGCGVTRDYRCASLGEVAGGGVDASAIDRCTLDPGW